MVRYFFQLLTIASLTVINANRWKQFQVIWNVPSEQCKKWQGLERPEYYGILVNKGHKFHGDIIVTLYEEKFGLYPYFSDEFDLNSAVNGGIPQELFNILQRVNLTAHLLKVRKDIEGAIQNKNFNGLAIIDYEKWRPLWDHNWYTKRIYRNASVDYVEERYKNLADKKAKEAKAREEFDEAAMRFLTETIRVAKETRPNALWGFYGMPFCNYSAGANGTVACGEVYEGFNDRLLPLYAKVKAFYPSIYLPKKESRSSLYVTSVLSESKRSAKKLEKIVPTYPFTGIEYFQLQLANPFYTKHDLWHTMVRAFDLNTNGVIIWSKSANMKSRCSAIGDYVRQYLGPKVVELKAWDRMRKMWPNYKRRFLNDRFDKKQSNVRHSKQFEEKLPIYSDVL